MENGSVRLSLIEMTRESRLKAHTTQTVAEERNTDCVESTIKMRRDRVRARIDFHFHLQVFFTQSSALKNKTSVK